ncbi:MAG: hypothetical protein R6U96_18675 [Promethearchaeia archaeon]
MVVRLILKKNRDQPIYEFFEKIKTHLGLKVNTEVARYCIKRTYEMLREKGKIK